MQKYKAQNLISVVCLAVALLCFSICLYCTRYIYSIDECFEKKDRIVEFNIRQPEGRYISGTPADLVQKIKPYTEGDVEAYTRTVYCRERHYNVEVGDKLLPYDLQVMEVDTTYHTTFAPQVVSGSWETAAHTPNAIVLFESTAKKIFGHPHQAIGQPMTLSRRLYSSPESTPRTGGIVYTIQAVIEDIPENNSIRFMSPIEALALNDSEGALKNDQRPGMTGMLTYALLREGKFLKTFAEEFTAKKLEYNIWNEDCSITASPMGQAFWESSKPDMLGNVTLIAGALILLVGMLNFFHFLTGSYMTRIREYSLRRVHGAKGFQLWAMLSTQSILLMIAVGMFTGLFMELSAPYLSLNVFNIRISIVYPLLLRQGGGYVLGLLGVCMVVAALIVWKVRRITVLKGIFGGGGVYGRHRLRNALLGVQLFICWLFVSLAAMLYLQADKSAHTVFGSLTVEEKEEIFSLSMDYPFMKHPEKRTMVEEMRTLPGVKDILIADVAYTGGVSGNVLYTEKGNPRSMKEIPLHRVTSNFFTFMNIPMQSGKAIEKAGDMVVDAGLEKAQGGELLGSTWYIDPESDALYTVTGISEPFIVSTQHNPMIPGFAFVADEFNEYFGHCYVKCQPEQKNRAEASLRDFLRKRLPENIEITMPTLMDEIRQGQAFEFVFRGIVGFMAVVAMVISLLGVYAAITLDTEYRRKEMAIRKVNGAGIRQIAWIFARLYVRLLVVSALLAFPIVAVVLHQIKSMYAFFIDTGVLFYGGIFVGVSAVIALTVGFRIHRIAKVNPAEIIRKE